MALLERVATLIRANLNDLVDKAEDPEKMIKQVILDMENQFLQVKTQVAIIDRRPARAGEETAGERKRTSGSGCTAPDLAVDKKDDALARAAVERSMSYKATAANFRQQVEDQKTQVENLKSALLQTAAEAGRGAIEERRADRPAPALARARARPPRPATPWATTPTRRPSTA